jgi:RNA polymerase sigma-70 factor (ECF subfamily)
MLGRADPFPDAAGGGSTGYADLSDEALMMLAQSRRTDAFEELYRRHAGAVASFVARICADRQVADEVTQTAFLTMWNNAGRFRPEAGRLRAWLLTIARNAAIDRARIKRVEVVPFEAVRATASLEAGPDKQVENFERNRTVRSALTALSEEQRTVIELAFFGGLTQTEIARVINEPLGTVKSRVRLGMQKLRRVLGPIQETLT